MKTQSPAARFMEALAPIGLPELPAISPERDQPPRASSLKEAAEAVGRWITINAVVLCIHLAGVKFLFFPG